MGFSFPPVGRMKAFLKARDGFLPPGVQWSSLVGMGAAFSWTTTRQLQPPEAPCAFDLHFIAKPRVLDRHRGIPGVVDFRVKQDFHGKGDCLTSGAVWLAAKEFMRLTPHLFDSSSKISPRKVREQADGVEKIRFSACVRSQNDKERAEVEVEAFKRFEAVNFDSGQHGWSPGFPDVVWAWLSRWLPADSAAQGNPASRNEDLVLMKR